MLKKILVIAVVILGISFGIYYLYQIKQDTNLNSKYSNCELGDLVGDDVQRIVYKNYNVDYHKEDFIKSQIENFAQECIDDGIINQYQMDCCMSKKMYPED